MGGFSDKLESDMIVEWKVCYKITEICIFSYFYILNIYNFNTF